MISLYAGRLLLVCSRIRCTWVIRVTLGPKPEQQFEIDTGAKQLKDARAQAQLAFFDAVNRIRPADAPRMCWDCLQWNMRKQGCDLQLPEAKRTGGRYAPRCELFKPWRANG